MSDALYHRLVLAIRSTEPRQSRLYMRAGRVAAAIHWWPIAGMVEVDIYDRFGRVVGVEAHDARTLFTAINNRSCRAAWCRVARLLLSPR